MAVTQNYLQSQGVLFYLTITSRTGGNFDTIGVTWMYRWGEDF